MQRVRVRATPWVEHYTLMPLFVIVKDIQLTNKQTRQHEPDNKHNSPRPRTRRASAASAQAKRASMTRKLTEHDTAIYKQARAELLRDQPLCHWCKRNTATELDHLVESDKGGTLEDGYVAACKPCNSARGATYRNRKLANAKQNREKAINDFCLLYTSDAADE